MSTTPAPIAQAVRLLREAAKDLKDCHTRGDGDWAGEPEALAAHDEHIAAAEALEQYARPQQCLHQISEPAAPAQPGTGLNWVATIDVFDGAMDDMELVPPRITLPDGSHRLYALPVTQGGA